MKSFQRFLDEIRRVQTVTSDEYIIASVDTYLRDKNISLDHLRKNAAQIFGELIGRFT